VLKYFSALNLAISSSELTNIWWLFSLRSVYKRWRSPLSLWIF